MNKNERGAETAFMLFQLLDYYFWQAGSNGKMISL